MKVKHINSFVFDLANYRVTDFLGEEIILSIDYKNNRFSLSQKELKSKKTKKEIEKVAKDLLKRKHNKNFAEKI